MSAGHDHEQDIGEHHQHDRDDPRTRSGRVVDPPRVAHVHGRRRPSGLERVPAAPVQLDAHELHGAVVGPERSRPLARGVPGVTRAHETGGGEGTPRPVRCGGPGGGAEIRHRHPEQQDSGQQEQQGHEPGGPAPARGHAFSPSARRRTVRWRCPAGSRGCAGTSPPPWGPSPGCCRRGAVPPGA